MPDTELADAASPTRPDGSRRRRRLVLALLGAAVLVAVAFAAFLAGRDGGGDDPGFADRPLPLGPSAFSPERQELLELLAAGRANPVHARYRAGDARLELWRSGDRVRQDTETPTPEGTLERTASFRRPEGAVSCRRSGNDAWRCEPGTAPGDYALSVTDDLEGRTVRARDATVNGRRVRCFTLSGAGESAEICLDRRGTLVRLATGGSALELEHAEAEVDNRVFEPPAPVGP